MMSNSSFSNEEIQQIRVTLVGLNMQTVFELILLRYQGLAMLSAISFGILGVFSSLNRDLITNIGLAITAMIVSSLVSVISFALYLYRIRTDINAMHSNIIEKIDGNETNPGVSGKGAKLDWYPEALFGFYVFSLMLFGLSLIC